jgi:translocation and assembly module TamA
VTYAPAKVNGSTYRKLDAKGKYVLAGQLILGGTCCTSLLSIPKDHRLFGGGGGSVRGFGFQKAGPWDQYDNAIGGRSLAAASLELRARVTDDIGVVPFVDAGSDYQTPLPQLDRKLFVGAGLGFRYFTAIGPLRLDLATPLNPHPVGDSPIQIYVGLGEAF